MVELALPTDPSEVDRALDELPNSQAVFLLWPRAGNPHLVRTNVLRKRLKRVLVELRDAGRVWGKGVRDTEAILRTESGHQDARVGAIVRFGQQHNVATPLNGLLLSLLEGI